MHPKHVIRKGGSHENKKYLAWIRKQNCMLLGCRKSPVQAHHVWHCRSNDFLAVPLCVEHHTAGQEAYHRLEHEEFEKAHKVFFEWEIIELLTKFIQEEF